MTAVVEAVALAREFEGPPRTVALRSFDLTVDSGEFVAIMGPSGAGKSTVLNVLGLLDRPTAGSLHLFGRDCAHLNGREVASMQRRDLGFVFQDSFLLGTRTVAENVWLRLALAGSPRATRRQRVEAALDRVGLQHRAAARARTLSGGEAQRAAIARAIVIEPKLLLADEPTGNLDRATAGGILELMTEATRRGVAVVAITHDPVVASKAGRVVELVDGVGG